MPADEDSPIGTEGEARPPAVDAPDPVPCSACRGTGQVISNLGGTAQQVPCPWCEGGGVRLTGHDAQADTLALREAAGEPGAARDGDGQDEDQSADDEPPDQVA